MENSYKALKSGVWYTASNFLVKSIGFITTPLFTRLLTKTEFGIFNNYSSWLTIITIFVTLNLESTLISARYDYEENFDEYILSVLSLSTLSCLFWFIVLNIGYPFFSGLTNLNRVYLNSMLLYLLFLPAVNLFQTRERYLFEYKKSVLVSCIISVGTAVVSVLLVCVMSNGILGRVLGSVIPTIIVGLIIYIYIINKGKRIKLQYWKYAIIICLPYIPHLLSNNLLGSMDRVMIEEFCGSEATALYSLAYTCGSVVTLLVVSINSAYSPWLASKLKDENQSEVNEFSKKYILIFMYFAFGIMLVAPEILLVLGGKSYVEAKYVIPPVAMGCVCQFLYTMFVNIEQYLKKTIGMAVATVCAAGINYILNYVFIQKYGYMAASYTTLVGYLILLAMHMFLVYKLGYSKTYNYRFIIVSVIVGCLTTILINKLYDMQYIRYFIILLYGGIVLIVGYKSKDVLYKIIKNRNGE